MDRDSVLMRFARMAGLSGEEAQEWDWLAGDAVSETAELLRAGADPADPRLVQLAAAICFHRWALLEDVEDETIRALDLSVSRKGGGRRGRAEALRREAAVRAAGLLRDQRFSFRQAGSAPGTAGRV